MNLEWLTAEITCEGRQLRPPLEIQRLTDEDLPEICLRMEMILASIEHDRCEGRWINLSIFEPLDTLSSVLQQQKEIPRIDDWRGFISTFGGYYGLYGSSSIPIHSHIAKDFATQIALLNTKPSP